MEEESGQNQLQDQHGQRSEGTGQSGGKDPNLTLHFKAIGKKRKQDKPATEESKEITKAYLKRLFKDAKKAAEHAERDTVLWKDLEFVRSLRREK